LKSFTNTVDLAKIKYNEMSRVRILLSAAIIVTLCCLAPLSSARGDIYGFKDENGVWHFTNVPSDPRYRLYMKTSGLKARPYIAKYDKIIQRASRQFDVDPHLIKAIIKAESSFEPDAISKSGAQGLMQLMPATARAMKVNNPFDPEQNILGGTKYLSLLLKRFKRNTRLAVAAYNVGATTVDKCNGIPPIPQTKRFVERVMEYYLEFRGNKE
jgi:soluble lytic murein transglycosylase-like protein